MISEDNIKIFQLLLTSYTNDSQKRTLNGNEIHSYLNDLYTKGKLHSEVINILVQRQILFLWKGNNPIHLHLLLPMYSSNGIILYRTIQIILQQLLSMNKSTIHWNSFNIKISHHFINWLISMKEKK